MFFHNALTTEGQSEREKLYLPDDWQHEICSLQSLWSSSYLISHLQYFWLHVSELISEFFMFCLAGINLMLSTRCTLLSPCFSLLLLFFHFLLHQLSSRTTSVTSLLGPGNSGKTPVKKPSIGQKKPLDTLGSSPPPSGYTVLSTSTAMFCWNNVSLLCLLYWLHFVFFHLYISQEEAKGFRSFFGSEHWTT